MLNCGCFKIRIELPVIVLVRINLKLIILISCIKERVIGNKHGDGDAGNLKCLAS
uniref:Uncharacterized protein n=1 Tax=Setaria italica TaxID=4555 RepID=K3YNN9_SETIT